MNFYIWQLMCLTTTNWIDISGILSFLLLSIISTIISIRVLYISNHNYSQNGFKECKKIFELTETIILNSNNKNKSFNTVVHEINKLIIQIWNDDIKNKIISKAEYGMFKEKFKRINQSFNKFILFTDFLEKNKLNYRAQLDDGIKSHEDSATNFINEGLFKKYDILFFSIELDLIPTTGLKFRKFKKIIKAKVKENTT